MVVGSHAAHRLQAPSVKGVRVFGAGAPGGGSAELGAAGAGAAAAPHPPAHKAAAARALQTPVAVAGVAVAESLVALQGGAPAPGSSGLLVQRQPRAPGRAALPDRQSAGSRHHDPCGAHGTAWHMAHPARRGAPARRTPWWLGKSRGRRHCSRLCCMPRTPRGTAAQGGLGRGAGRRRRQDAPRRRRASSAAIARSRRYAARGSDACRQAATRRTLGGSMTRQPPHGARRDPLSHFVHRRP